MSLQQLLKSQSVLNRATFFTMGAMIRNCTKKKKIESNQFSVFSFQKCLRKKLQELTTHASGNEVHRGAIEKQLQTVSTKWFEWPMPICKSRSFGGRSVRFLIEILVKLLQPSAATSPPSFFVPLGRLWVRRIVKVSTTPAVSHKFTLAGLSPVRRVHEFIFIPRDSRPNDPSSAQYGILLAHKPENAMVNCDKYGP